MTDTTAAPPKFHLMLRLVDADAVPFSTHEFRVTWGSSTIRGQTTADGVVDILVDGTSTVYTGTLELGTLTGGKFKGTITIPLASHNGESTKNVASNFGRTPTMYSSQGPPAVMSYDVGWRLSNLMYLPWIPTAPSYGGMQSTPTIPNEISDAIRRFKADHHTTLGITGWLDGTTQSLSDTQDDVTIKLLVQLHDNVTDKQADDKLWKAKSSMSATMAGEPL